VLKGGERGDHVTVVVKRLLHSHPLLPLTLSDPESTHFVEYERRVGTIVNEREEMET
jgi:hypothetical protein